MAGKTSEPRKQRTRQHVIADLSIHHVEGFILEAGHTAQRIVSDYGYDLVMNTFDEEGYAEPGLVYFQFKAMEALDARGSDYVYDLDIRDYNLWVREVMPVIVILFDASRRRAYWVAVRQYFDNDLSRLPKKGAKTVRIRVPKRQAVNGRAIESMRVLRSAALREAGRTS
jgi:hypothetical protein